MKFYEFNKFDYYALIGAESEEKAVEYYEEIVSDIEEDDESPDEITEEEAKEKLINACKDSVQEKEAKEEFERGINRSEPYLVLIDGSLL